MMTLELKTLNDKHFECRVDYLGKLTPSDLNAFQASTLSTSFSEYITDVQFVAHHSFNQLTSLIN